MNPVIASEAQMNPVIASEAQKILSLRAKRGNLSVPYLPTLDKRDRFVPRDTQRVL